MYSNYKHLCEYSSRFRILKGGKISLVVSALVTGTTISFASPSGGTINSGSAIINQNGGITTITKAPTKPPSTGKALV